MQIGHQLITNVEVVKIAKREAARAEEGRLAGAACLEEKIIEVLSLWEVLEKEGQISLLLLGLILMITKHLKGY